MKSTVMDVLDFINKGSSKGGFCPFEASLKMKLISLHLKLKRWIRPYMDI